MSRPHFYWFEEPSAFQSQDWDILSLLEKQRADKMIYHRIRFVAWRAQTRRILSSYLQCQPQDVPIEIHSSGKPFILERDLHFNVSHSANRALLAISSKPLGVDLEFEKSRNVLEIAKRAFAIKNLSDWENLTSIELSNKFYRRWTIVESVFKLLGGDWIPIWHHEFEFGSNVWQGQEFLLNEVGAPRGFYASVAELV